MYLSAAERLVAHAVDGKHVLVVATDRPSASRAFVEMVRLPSVEVGPTVTRIRYGQGRECIETEAGGSITFSSTRSIQLGAIRGRDLDIVYLFPGASADRRELLPALVTTRGMVIRG